jgi:Rv2993c-like, N-terminal
MHWLRFSRRGRSGFGILEADRVRECRGDMFSAWERTDELIALDEIRWETPCMPTKMIAHRRAFEPIRMKLRPGKTT